MQNVIEKGSQRQLETSDDSGTVLLPDETTSLLDAPFLGLFSLNLEMVLYTFLVGIAIVTRFWDLGARVMSHDESLHALYSWKLYAGQGYQHSPMMHGPFLFHFNALIYFLFGDNDFTARVSTALFGVILVFLPYFLRKWLGRTGALATSALLTISPSILYYSRYIRNEVFILVWSMLMIIALFKYVDDRQNKWLYLGAIATILSILTKEVSYMMGFTGLTFIILVAFWERMSEAAANLLYLAGIIIGLILTILAVVFLLFGGGAAAEGGFTVGHLVQYIVLIVGFDLAALAVGVLLRREERTMIAALRSISPAALAISLSVSVLIFALLSTTFFTNPRGLWTASGGAVFYWLEQHGVQRGDQPWYYYIALLLPLYEFVPALFGLGGIIYYLIRGVPRREGQVYVPFVPFLTYWIITSLLLYSWAGEKMPWLVVHLALPLILISGRFVGDILDGIEWREVWRRGGALFALLIPLILLALGTLVRTSYLALQTVLRVASAEGPSLQKLNTTGQWLSALLIGALLIFLAVHYGRRLGRRRGVQIAFITLLVFLSLFTVRFAWMANYIHYDYPNEFIVYAHGGPDVKMVMDQIADISCRTVGDKLIKVAYDDDSTWPLEWYMRQYPNRAFYGAQPGKEALDAPVVIVGNKNEEKVKPYLGKRYNRFDYRLVWWPIEEYKRWTFQSIFQTLRQPGEWAKLWNIIFYRKFDTPFNSWPFVHRFALYVRKDVSAELWDYGVGPLQVAEEFEDPYVKKRLQVASLLTWGAQGVENGQFKDPHGLAVDAEGHVYVADSGNHRLQKFGPDGEFLAAWGSQGNGPGQFNEPWGLTIDDEGYVYVADTWNHRIQKFDPEGNFLLQWGAFGNTQGATDEMPGLFWGPRDIATDAQGQVYVTDTGNKRVQVFSPQGEFVRQWGMAGLMEGQFDEPVGIDLDQEGHVYVADTWNQRIQTFDQDLNFVAQWPVLGWESNSVINKPYLAVDEKGRVYVTDPENYRLLIFDNKGALLATFGEIGLDERSFNLPVGLDVDDEGHVYVADSANQRIMKFGPLQALK